MSYYYLLLLFPLTCYLLLTRLDPRRPSFLSSTIPFLGSAIPFFTRRWDFITNGIRNQRNGVFRFNLAHLQVIGVGSKEGIEAFFNTKQFSLADGYAILFGSPTAAHEIKSLDKNTQDEAGKGFNRRLIALMKRERFLAQLPTLIEVTNQHLDELGSQGVTDPFESIYGLVFRLTMVTVGCVELVNDRILLAKVLKLFEDIESSSTAFTILFPSLPSPARIRRLVSGTRLYFILKELVDARAREGRTEEDPLQFLIDSGDTIPQMIEFIMSALVAGLLNSGINACYVLAYLAQSPIDIARARAEINAVVAKYEAEEFFDDPSSLNLSEKVSRLPLDAWESEFPFLDNCLRDSIRLNASGTGFRKNVGEEMFIGDERIPSGAILAFPFHLVHADPEIYPDPLKWDPKRYDEGREEDKKGGPLAYLGWGSKRSPCLGRKFANLESNIITALFLARFDEYSVVNTAGTHLDILPPTNLNQHSAQKPSENIYLKFNSS